MSTTHATSEVRRPIASSGYTTSLFRRYWGAFQERRKRERSRNDLCSLSNRELMDIGITRAPSARAVMLPSRSREAKFRFTTVALYFRMSFWSEDNR